MKKTIALLITVIISITLIAQQNHEANVYAVASWDKTSHDFGKIEYNQPAKVVFTFTNIGTQPIQIYGVERGCNMTVSEYPVMPIPPGEKGIIKVEFDGKLIGYFSKVIRVKMNTEKSVTELYVTGESRERTINQ